ncbi:MAG TPA: OmpA family protein [Burkholderiales bacterium]
MIHTKKVLAGVVGAAAVLMSAAAFAQQGTTSAYWRDSSGQVWKNSYGQCWRSGYWTPALAAEDKDGCACDKDLLPKEKCEPPAPPPPPAPKAEPAPPPPPPPPPPKMAPEKVTFSADVLFDFDKAVLKPEGKQALDAFADKLKGVNYEVITDVGHTDRIGSEQYNKKLSVRRAEAVKAYLVGKGIPANKVYADGKGEADPVTKPGQCKGEKANKALIQCLQPDRRVDIEVAGTREAK